MARTSDTRERILDAGADLFRQQGYESTALKAIVRSGGAPWGSLYHYFPGGKEELGALALERSGERFRRLIETAFEQAGGPAQAIRRMFDLSAAALEASNYADGCPVATVALESANTNESLRQACEQAFASWLSTLERALCEARIEPVAARRLSVFGLSAFEGAIVLSRTLRSTEPLSTSAEVVARIIDSTRSGAIGWEQA